MTTQPCDLTCRQFCAAIRGYGFRRLRDNGIAHPEIRNGAPLAYSLLSYRQALADLVVQLREARARRRGGRFVTTLNSNVRTRSIVHASVGAA